MIHSRRRANGAGDGNRTHVSSLGSYSSTIELHPRKAIIADQSGGIEDPVRCASSHRLGSAATSAAVRKLLVKLPAFGDMRHSVRRVSVRSHEFGYRCH
jgi:hypothetical protein